LFKNASGLLKTLDRLKKNLVNLLCVKESFVNQMISEKGREQDN
jgi:hypothetical protein